MTGGCVASKATLQSSLKASSGEIRTLATADHANAARRNEDDAATELDIHRPAEEARAAAIHAPLRVKRATGNPADVLRALENRHRWLLFAQHCYTCSRKEQGCELGKLCTYGKKTLKHVAQCRRDDCAYPRCGLLKPLLQHSRKCQSSTCAICVPVWNYIQRDLQQQHQSQGMQQAPQLSPNNQDDLPPQSQHQHASAVATHYHLPLAVCAPPVASILVASASAATESTAAARRDVEAVRVAADTGDEPSVARTPGDIRQSCGAATSQPDAGNDANRHGQTRCIAAQAQAAIRACNVNGEVGGEGLQIHSGDAGPHADKQQHQQPQPRQVSESLHATNMHMPPVRPLHLQQLHQQPPIPQEQQQQRQLLVSQKQHEQGQQQHPPLQQTPPPQLQSVPVLGPPLPSASMSGTQQFLATASGAFPSFTLPTYTCSLAAQRPLGGSPADPSERLLPRAGVTITATPPQPIPIPALSGTALRPPPSTAAAQPQLVHTYPPSAAILGHFFPQLQQQQQPHAAMHQQPQGPAAATVGAPHWLPLSAGMAALPRAAASLARGAPAPLPCGSGGGGSAAGGGPCLLDLVASGAAAASTAANPPSAAAAAALWHSQKQLRGGPVALYGIAAPDAVRPPGFGAMVQTGSMQSVGHPYTLTSMGGAGGLPAAGGALAMATAPLFLWPGFNQPTAATSTGATPTAVGAIAGAAQGSATAQLSHPYTVVGPGGPRVSTDAPGLGGAAAAPAAPMPELPASAASVVIPAAHPLVSAPHNLPYGLAALAPGSSATTVPTAAPGATNVSTAVAGVASGVGGAAPGPAGGRAGITPWSYLVQ